MHKDVPTLFSAHEKVRALLLAIVTGMACHVTAAPSSATADASEAGRHIKPGDELPVLTYEQTLQVPVGGEYMFQGFHYIRRENGPEKLGHQPGCRIDPSIYERYGYRPISSPDCREKADPPLFPGEMGKTFRYPAAPPQTHGLDLSQVNEATALAYFDWLCKHDAGIWITRRIDSVDGVAILRTYDSYQDWRRQDRYYLEDPWGHVSSFPMLNAGALVPDVWATFLEHSLIMVSQAFGGPTEQTYLRFDLPRYLFVERPVLPDEKRKYPGYRYLRIETPWPKQPAFTSDIKDDSFDGEWSALRLRQRERIGRPPGKVWVWTPVYEGAVLRTFTPEPTNTLKARYGFLWRGIERSPYDRALAIAGTEQMVVDLHTNEIIGLTRTFMISYLADHKWVAYERPHISANKGGGMDWANRQECTISMPEQFKRTSLIESVLGPADVLRAKGVDLRVAPTPREQIRNR